MTDYSQLSAEWAERNRRLTAANNRNRCAVFDALAALGVRNLTIAFDGCGDAGQIGDIEIDGAGALTGEIAYAQAQWTAPDTTATVALAEAVEYLCYALLEQEYDGWETDSGAFGVFTFDTARRAIELEFNCRFETLETAGRIFGEA